MCQLRLQEVSKGSQVVTRQLGHDMTSSVIDDDWVVKRFDEMVRHLIGGWQGNWSIQVFCHE